MACGVGYIINIKDNIQLKGEALAQDVTSFLIARTLFWKAAFLGNVGLTTRVMSVMGFKGINRKYNEELEVQVS